jgi:hypothetical protein
MTPSRFAAILTPILATALSMGAGCARAGEIVMEQSAVQKLVVDTLFKDNGRYYVQKAGACRVYLETPSVTLNSGRVVIRSHLSGRFGQDLGASCLGVGLSAWTVVSGLPTAQGATVRLVDVRVDDVDDPNLRFVLDSGLVPSLPGAIEIDVLKAVRTMLLQGAGGQIQTDVQTLVISAVSAADNKLSIRFDFRLLGR